MGDDFQFKLAKTYLDGNDEEKALDGLEMMKKLAENGNADAAFEVGLVYSEGCLVINDQEEAKKWYELGAKLGSGAARAKLEAIERGDDPRTVAVPASVNDEADQPPQEDGPRFKCGKCGQIVQMKISRRIDATDNAQLKNQVVTGQFFSQVCPHCGTAGIVPYPCVYVDNRASLFVDVCSDRQTALNDEDTKSGVDDGGWDEQWRMQGAHNVRVAVDNLNALREIILIVDAGLDPYALAMCKKIIRDEQGIKARDHIYFACANDEDKTITFWYVDAGTHGPKDLTMPRLSYENVVKLLCGADFEPLRMCELIDEDSIAELLDRTASFDPRPTEEFWQKKEEAKGHNPAALFNLGVAYYYGEGVHQNRYKAFKCFREAAEAKDSDAQYALSVCYARGYGTTPSPFRAGAWLKSAAEGGCADAQFQMGVRSENGDGEEKDVQKAYEWYQKAFDQKHGPAAKAIGRLFEFGLLGGEADVGAAYEWYGFAIQYGDESAKEDRIRAEGKLDREEPTEKTPPPQNGSGHFPFKVGKMLQKVFPVLFDEGKVGESDIEFLMSPTASKRFKTGGAQVLKETLGDVEEDAKDHNGRKRFYSRIVLNFGGKRYLLTSQWFDKSLDPILAWLGEHGIDRSRAAQICIAAGLTPEMNDDEPERENPVEQKGGEPPADASIKDAPNGGNTSDGPTPEGGKPMAECGICHEKFEPVIHETFNLDEDPELAKRACDLSIFAQRCPHCHGMTNVPYPTTLIHLSKRYLIRFTFDRNEAMALSRARKSLLGGANAEGVRQRVVCSVPAFLEKVRLFNQGLDDNIVEAMKLVLLSGIEGKEITNILFAGIANGRFKFMVFVKGKSEPENFDLPGEVYDGIEKDTAGKFPEGFVRYVSHVTVSKILNGETDDDKIDPFKVLDVFATCGGKLGLLKQRNFNIGPWKQCAIEIASKLCDAVKGDPELAGDYTMMRNIGVFAALHIGLGASVEWVANKAGFNSATIYDMMMLEGGFCRVAEIPFEKLAAFTNEDFETTFRKYSDALEAIARDIAVQTNRNIDPNAAEKPSAEMLEGYWELLHKEFFGAFLCGMNAGLLLQNEGAQLNVKGGVSVAIDYAKHINLALAQNKCALISSIKIKNVTDQKMEGLVCRISSPDEFFKTKTVEVGPLWPGAESELGSVRPSYNVGLLRKLEDAQEGGFRVEISAGDETLFSQDYEIQALAADQSHDIWAFPIFLASFVRPNCEAIHQLQSEVAREMQKIAGGDASLAGYQLDREHVFKMCAAMYRAIQKKGVSYSNPASSFNLPGQKIRMPDTVFKYKLATCLDSTILFASIMEACQLHPVLILISGHAFVGCFLTETHLPQIEMRDPQVLRKLIAANEFIAIETTMVTSDKTFEDAERFGREVRLASECDGDFYCAVDVVSARNTGVMPLSMGNGAEDSEFVAEGHEVDQEGVGKLRRIVSVDISKLKKAEAPKGRVAVWAQKLLDLSPLNKLLNAKAGKDVMPFDCPDVGKLEDWLASNCEIPVRSVVDAFSTNDIAELKKNKGRMSTERIRQIIEAEFACQRICVDDGPRVVVRNLKTLYKLGKQDLEETGAQTLFAAIGFVEWRDPKKRSNAAAYRAPIILVPIRIGQQRTDAGICISRRDDETVVNTTLLQFLRAQYQIEVPGLDPLPLDDAGLDVPHILQIFRECLKRAADLEVVEGAALGHFSFGKFAMWRDLMEHHDVLEQHPLVGHLINAGGRFNDGIEVFSPKEIAAHLKPDEIFCPVSADSSQLTAVLYSQLGKSFVLYGPPGTGKSQTITNMIAHNLALGRRVLFVSEKKAALDVVHKRLKEVGLEPFCLELHSNKGDRGSVMAQFESALAVTRDKSAEEWQQSASKIAEVRDDLAGYVNALHHVYPNRLSAYDCFSRSLLQGEPKYQELITADTLTQTWEQKEEQKNALKSLIIEIRNTTPQALAAIPRLKEASWSVHYERDLKLASEKLRDACAELRSAYADVADRFSFSATDDNAAIARSIELLKVVKAENKAFSNLGNGNLTPEQLKEMLNEAERREARKNELLSRQAEARESLVGWDIDKLLILDIKAVRDRIEEVSQTGFLMHHFKVTSFLKEFAELKKSLGKLTLPELSAALVKTEKLKAANKEVEKARAEDAKLAETSRKTDAPDPEASALKDELVAKIDRVLSAWEAYQSARTAFAGFAEEEIIGDNPDATRTLCENLLQNLPKIRGVFRYRPFRNTADQLGVSGFADKFESGEIPANELLRAFDDAYLGKMLYQIEETNPILPEFFGRSHEAKIEEFQRLIDRYSDLSQQAIFARIASRYPDFGSSSFTKEENRQLGVLQREMHKKKGQTSVRSLLADVGELVGRYKPCFLMSPLSVAQFLEMDIEPFDLIIFDEASQIEVCDAVGVIARGKQVIVVGDPQQMPPTNFFGGTVGLESLKAVEDAESILVECLDVGLPKTYLNWHYRSRHESLIAFSNHNYYEDELFSFPSVSESERLGVKFHLVKNGVYGHGTNPIEAKAVVDYVCAKVRSERYRKHPRSIGIVTFNMQQQGLIEEMIDARCESDPDLKDILLGYETSDGSSPEASGEKPVKRSDEKMFFVRNLENVQGDEADVIIFSITFGPDEKGKVSMNFGPLNRDGGERRLNVAVTRAREQMVVFSSMRYTRIETDADSSLGARGLRDFLEYAQSGSRSSSCKAAIKPDAGFGNVVAGFLEKHGYKVVRNVGYSGYKIDMAVLNPYNPKEYLLGIECDGPSYAQQLTVRDRDVLRSSVLARGGWKMCRVWCAEWYHDREGAESRLLELLESIKPTEPTNPDTPGEDDVPEEIFVEPPTPVTEEKDEEIFKKPDTLEKPPEQPKKPEVPVQPPVPPDKPPEPPVPPSVEPPKQEPPLEPPKPQTPVVPPVAPLVPPPPPVKPVQPPKPQEPVDAPPKPMTPPPAPEKPQVVSPGGHTFPLTEAALANVRYPLGLQIDGVEIRIVASWPDCYLSLCEKLNEIDSAKFEALPDQPMFKRFFVRAVPRKKYPDCYPAKLGSEGDVRAKVIGSKSYFYMPNYVVYNLLKHYGIEPQKVTIRA